MLDSYLEYSIALLGHSFFTFVDSILKGQYTIASYI
jgi:hypothetical protein